MNKKKPSGKDRWGGCGGGGGGGGGGGVMLIFYFFRYGEIKIFR